MKKRSPKFHLNDCVLYVTHGKIIEARVVGIHQRIDDDIDKTNGKKKFSYDVTYCLSGIFPAEIGRSGAVSFSAYSNDDKIFKNVDDAKNYLNKHREKEFVTVSNSAYVRMKNLSEIKDCDDDQKEFVKEAKRFCRKLREFNKRKYGVRTPVIGFKGGANFQ